MGKNIKVSSYDQLEATAKTLEDNSAVYTQIYQQLLQEAETMGAAWEGVDNQAFVEQIKGFTDDLKQMAQRLLDAAEVIRTEKEGYIARQDTNVTEVRKLQN